MFIRNASVSLFASFALLGCYVEQDDDYYQGGYYGPPSTEVREATIDTDEIIETEPGAGAGLFVEYESGGRWRVFSTCDTDVSGYACEWDVVVGVDAEFEISGAQSTELEAGDIFNQPDHCSLRFVTQNATGFDGFTFETAPGEPLRVDVLLDGRNGQRYLYWVGEGGIQAGAPSNPMDLRPSTP